MKINKRLRKAFTLVELVVVIAIIAILSTVSVVTYFGITNSAKKSVDDQTITQWNQLLLLEEELGNKSETPQEALDIILENGWDVAKLTPTYEGNEILWDQEENRFLILDKDTVTNSRVRNAYESSRKGEYWRFLKDYSEPKGYSVYITDPEFKVSETLIVTAGIDLSRVTEKVDVKYENVSKDQKVILNTNGGTLEVSDANVEVKHFGTASKSTVSSKSYEEKGTVVGDTLVNGGKYIATSSEAEAGTVLVSSKDVELNISASAKVGTVAGTTDEAQAAIKSNTNIPSDKKLDSDTAVVPTTDFAGGLGTENSPYLISTTEQFLKIKNFAKEMATKGFCFSLVNDIDLSGINSNLTSVSTLFQGTLDGNNYTIKSNNSLNSLFSYATGYTLFKDFTVELNHKLTRVINSGATISENNTFNLTYNNVDLKGVFGEKYNLGGDNSAYYADGTFGAIRKIINNEDKLEVSSTSVFIDSQYMFVTIENCDVYVDFKMTGDRAAVFCGGQVYNMNFSIKNSSYYGTFYGANPGLVFANAAYCSGSGLIGSITLENVKLEGTLVCLNKDKPHGVTFANNSQELEGVLGSNNVIECAKDNNMAITTNESGEYEIIAASDKNVDSYLVQLSLGKLFWYDDNQQLTSLESSNHMISIMINSNDINQTGLYKTKTLSIYQAEKEGIDINSLNWNLTEEGKRYCFADYQNEKILVLDVYGEFANNTVLNVAYVIGNIADKPTYYYASNK